MTRLALALVPVLAVVGFAALLLDQANKAMP